MRTKKSICPICGADTGWDRGYLTQTEEAHYQNHHADDDYRDRSMVGLDQMTKEQVMEGRS